MSPKAALIAGLVVLTAVLGLGYLLSVLQTVDAPVGAPDDQATMSPADIVEMPEETPPERLFIERETVEGMLYGLRYEQAEALFGFPSDTHDTEYDPGVQGYTSPFVIHWHVWENEDGSKVRLGFINNRLDRKQYIAPDGSDALPEAPHVDVDSFGEILGIEE